MDTKEPIEVGPESFQGMNIFSFTFTKILESILVGVLMRLKCTEDKSDY